MTTTQNRIGGQNTNRVLVEVAILAPVAILGLLPNTKVPKPLAFAAIAVVGIRAFEKIRSL